ncbi:16S rRNA (uracil(1498)-N(3))-methyltransferase [Ornithinimicrobium pekingense]|uniref:Ribosomal RNA small subunit methyltransferase E n=1 Tax=Ornithinimicrobium pekingense TaxID=384677 RepID=A0ABQ2F4P3_9MICO|nr:16S rRNA (uracil(1498)-N(3))-methyltransferase [Ornithinimicrobium pekingense]GGK61672.1 ribosomal RNA small subunit methyltransferase E [Ornithinimicrobium pekingense]
MSAPLFLVGAGTLPDGTTTVHLDGPEGRHAADVQRLTVGERVLLSDGAGRLARCTVSAASRGSLDLRVEDLRDEPLPARRLVLVQALAKGDRDLMAVEAATELDVDEVVPWQADRSIVRWKGERGEKARGKWEQTARAATKQSRRARVPVVAGLVGRAALLDRVGRADLAVVLHEEAGTPLTGLALPARGEILLVVGPEGGISPDELAALVDAGARPVRLGRTVLRTSTAGAAALAALHTLGGWR